MTKDRLAELLAAQSSDDDEVIVLPYQLDATTDSHDEILDAFFAEVEDIRSMIHNIQTNIEEVKTKRSCILSAPQNVEKTQQELEDLMAEIQHTANKIRARLKTIEPKDQTQTLSTDLVIRKTQHSSLFRRFVDVMTEYNQSQIDYRERYKWRIRRQLEITGRQTTDEELEEMLEQGNPAVFTQGIITETLQARQVLEDIEARHADFVRLENSIKELHDIFMEMMMLVEMQGEVVDRVEYFVGLTVDHVELGRTKLKAAEKFQSKVRRKKIWIVIGLIVIAGLIALIVTLSITIPK